MTHASEEDEKKTINSTLQTARNPPTSTIHSKHMSDRLSVRNIAAARNQKLATEQTETSPIAAELEGAHQDALALKHQLRQQEGEAAVPQQQAFPHGSTMASAEPSKEHTGVGETVAEGIANADQGVTTALRDAVHRASEGVSAAGNAAANVAGAAVDKTKETLQSTLGTRAANAEGEGLTKGYEGAVFSSDDPEYKDNTGGVTVSRTPPHTLDELKASSPNPIISSPKEDTPHSPRLASLLGLGSTNKLPPGSQPAIATPTELAQQPASLGEGSVGIAAGDPKGGANVVAAAHTVSKGVVSSIKGAFSGSTGGPVAGAPAGPSDPDPRTANVPVGDFRALHEALGIATSDGSSTHHKGSSSSSSSGDATAPAAAAAGGDAAAADSRGTTDEDNAGALPSAQEMREGWEGLKSQAQEGLEAASDRVQQGLESASQRVEAAVGPEGGSSSSSSGGGGTGSARGGGGILGGLAGIVSGIANKVNLANSSEELLAGGAVPDAAAGTAAADGPTATPAPEATAATNAASGSSADATAAAKGAAVDTTTAVKQGAAELRDRASETAGAAAASVKGAAESVKDAAGGAAGLAADTAQSAKDSTADAAATARDSAARAARQAAGRASGAAESVREAAGNAAERAADAAASARDSTAEAAGEAAGRASGAAEQAKESAGGALSSLVQGAKEGFVGAYDKAAAVLVGDDKPSPPAADAGNSTSRDTPAAAQPPSNIAGLSGDSNLQSGAVGSGHAAVPKAGIGAVLKQGWEDLKHGGAKAPHAVSTGGETAASYDVTSNIERSKHLEDEQQAKIYKAEVYSVSPGSQAASDQAATDARKTGPVAGDGRAVTGAVPHDKPDTSKVHADQTTCFDGNKGMATGFGTGSAAPYSGDTSIKDVAALFAAPHSSLDMGGLSTEEQQALVEVAAQAGASSGRQDSTSEGGLSSWVSSMSAVWHNLGVASAKGPGGGGSGSGSSPSSTKELKDSIQWDNPTQDAVIDPVRGVTKKEGHSPGHKIQMRTGEQIPPDSDPSDPQFFKDKAERVGKVVSDTLTTSSEEAAADPNNLKGKSSDNKPDGLAHFTKHEAQEAAAAVGRAPEAAASALGTAGAIVSGVAGHFVDKAKELSHNITQHGDFLSAEERTAKSKAAVERVEKQMEQLGDITSDHRAVQELQEERIAAIGNPAHKRETLVDKIIGPMVSDASDDTHARELAASYNEWQHDREYGSQTSDTAAGSSGSSGGGGSSSSMGGAVSDLKQEACDTARSTKEVVHMEGQVAGEGVQTAANQAESKVGGAIDSVKGLATEAADTAHAAGEVVSMEVSEAADAVRCKTDQAASSARDTARDMKQSAQDTAQRTSDSVRDTADRTAAVAKDTAHRAGDSTRQTADAAKGVTDSAGEKLQEGVDAVAHGTGFVAGAGAEKLSEAQEAAACAGDKVGSAAGGVLAGVADTARGLLGALMGPVEREGAFDESTAALTGPPPQEEPVGAEQVSGLDIASTQARPTVKRASDTTTTTKTTTTTTTTTGSGRSAGVAAAPAGADSEELQGRVQRGLNETQEAIKARVQAGIDDTAYATGVTAGHIESVVETAKQQIAAVTEDIHVPPAELTTNTEDLLRQRQQQL